MNQFRDVIVQAAINEAQVTLKRAQGIESTYPNVAGKSLWGSCVDYFDGIVFTLNMVLDHSLESTPLDAQTWLSAGLSYINMCEKGFGRASYARVLVEVEASKGIVDSVEVWYRSLNRSMKLKVEYAWQPPLCSH